MTLDTPIRLGKFKVLRFHATETEADPTRLAAALPEVTSGVWRVTELWRKIGQAGEFAAILELRES